MVQSAECLLSPGSNLIFYVFTDQPEEASAFESSLSRSRIVPITTPSLGWPDATLLRYELFHESWDQVQGDVVIHLDADMYFVSEAKLDPDPSGWKGGIALVRHPGYRRPRGFKRLKLYLSHPKMLGGDLKLWLRLGALGSWETSKDSQAYVSRNKRLSYVCGGTWMGLREPLGTMISELANRTRSDLHHGIVARWHDESHLNWFASIHTHELMDSEKCFAQGYSNLEDLTPEIIAVDKGTDRTR